MVFKSKSLAEHVVLVKNNEPDEPRGKCLITLEQKPNGSIFIDSNDIYAIKSDKEFGSPCNTLCGFSGASSFGVEIPKIFKASFPCDSDKNLTLIENAICHDETLAKLDLELNKHFLEKKSKSKELSSLTTSQKNWINSRNKSCIHSSKLTECLKTSYQSRLKEL